MPKKCLDKFQLLADQVVFVGDSENDILPAKRLGMFSVHVTYGYGKLQEKIKADLVISKIKELRKFFNLNFNSFIKKLINLTHSFINCYYCNY